MNIFNQVALFAAEWEWNSPKFPRNATIWRKALERTNP